MDRAWEHLSAICPKRGPGLSHTQDGDERPDGNCVHCGIRLRSTEDGIIPPLSGLTPPLNIVERLKALGLFAPQEERDPILVEPQMITGEGPKGNTEGPGRGPLTTRQEMKLMFVAWLNGYAKPKSGEHL